MKTSLKKLRGFALRHSEHKERKDLRPLAPVDDLAQASQDMEDMRDCYDVFLSSAAATANSAFELSEALQEMGSCLLEKTALNDDEESGKALLMLGKVQFQLQKLVDRYRSHIFQTITVPSESLLNELRTVEEMKQQCDEKRDVYEYMMMRQREKGRGRSGKAETFSMHQIQEAHDEYDAEATLFIFRMKSLKEGQSRSLLTQAARHHAAQLCFFKKAVEALEGLEPHLKLVTEQQHIDYHFNGLEDGDGDDDFYDDGEDDGDTDDGELSFDYGRNDQEQNVSTSANSTELDLMDITFPQVATLEASEEHQDTSYRKSFSLKGDVRTSSQSAPLFANIIYDTAENMKQMQPSLSKKFNSYVLPTPVDTKSSNSTGSVSLVTPMLKTDLNGQRQDAWHSSPLEPKKSVGEKFPASMVKNAESVLKENNRDADSNQQPPPLADRLFISRFDPPTTTDSKKIKRYAFSGPITGKAGPNKSASADAIGLFSSGPIKSKVWPYQSVSTGTVGLFSGPLAQNPVTQVPSSPPKVSPELLSKVSPTASPTFMSSPIISELHELPRPPSSSISMSSRPLSLIGHSAPLMPKNNMPPTSTTTLEPHSASPLPVPSQAISRSLSTPSSNLKAMAMNIAKPLEATRSLEKIEDTALLPSTPISLSNVQLSSTTQEITQTGQ